MASVVSDSVLPHRWQPTRLPRPWDSPGKNTGVGCHFLFQCMKVKSESEVTQSCPILRDPMDCSLPGSSVHGIFQARGLEWGAFAFSSSKLTFQVFSPLAWLTKHSHQDLKSNCPDFFLCSMLPYYWPFYSESEEVLQDESHRFTTASHAGAKFSLEWKFG